MRTVNSRLGLLPPYLFIELDRKKREALRRGVDVINLGIGDPDLPTPPFIVEAMTEAVRQPKHHQYPLGKGLPELRNAIAGFMLRRFEVKLDPDREILVLIGAKEGIGHLPLALASPGDKVLVPDPGYPPYYSGTILANATPVRFPLKEDNGFLPDLGRLPKDAKLLFLNYPNNPTGAVADEAFFTRVVAWAKANGSWVAHDAAYAECFYGADAPPSFLKTFGAKEVGLEFHSFSKTFYMTGWRVAWACGNAEAISALAQVKDNVDSGAFGAVQEAALKALQSGSAAADEMRRVQGRRRRLFSQGLSKLGWGVFESSATFYLWCQVPSGKDSAAWAVRLLEEAGIVASPGIGFGPAGEGYLRFALTVPEPRLREALGRIAKIKWSARSTA